MWISRFWLKKALPCFIEVFKQSVKLRLKYQFIQKWHEPISQGEKCTLYRIIQIAFGFENYVNKKPPEKLFHKVWMSESSLTHRRRGPVTGHCDMRICQFCETDIGDKFYYLPCFPHEERKNI